jgi:GTPase
VGSSPTFGTNSNKARQLPGFVAHFSSAWRIMTAEFTRSADGKKLFATAAPRERAFLVGAEIGAHPAWPAEDSLNELALLCDTAGLDVVGRAFQRMGHPFPKQFIGPGKLKEIAALREEYGYQVLVFDDELTPAQNRTIEQETGVRVLDRTQLILDIFASHAHTYEGRLQVELAQYEYLLPRLRRAWTHLERQAGGSGTAAGGVVGLRGPGETQLELDRRLIGKRIAWLKEQLGDVHRHRELYRERRRKSGVPIVALVGYTNAGKSTLLNALTGAGVRAEDRLFATLDPTTRQITLPGGAPALLTDTVGFIQKLPTQLVAAFRATLEEIVEADLLLHVLDITHANAEQHTQAVTQTLEELGVAEKPRLTVLNKVDLLEGVGEAQIASMTEDLGLPSDYVAVSAQRNWGIDGLLARVEQHFAAGMVDFAALIPYNRNDLVALWHERGFVETEDYGADGTCIHGRVPSMLLDQLRRFAVNGATQPRRS